MKKKKYIVNKIKVLVFVTFLMIIIGGIVVGGKYIYDKYNDFSLRNSKKNEKRNNNTSENNDENINETTVSLEKAPTNLSEYQSLEDGEYLTSKGYTLKIENGVASVDGHLIVNKTYSVPEWYKPNNPFVDITGERCNSCIEKEVMDAFKLMESDATSIGLNIYLSSGYRSYSYQIRLYNNYTSVSGVEKADTYSARAGHSEHQTGLCFDLNSINDSFANTDEGRWINENAHLYGFIIRYPKGKESITGYQYESWHLRYVGVDLANKLYNNGDWITMEEYFGISSSY